MRYKSILTVFILTFSTACKSQSVLPLSDLDEIKKGRSILSTYTCEDLIEKAQDTSFSLRGLASLRALAKCPEFKYDLSQLSDLEKKLYASEIESFAAVKADHNRPELTVKELKKAIKNEKKPEAKLALYKTLRAKLKKATSKTDFVHVTDQMFNWATSYYKKNKTSAVAADQLYEVTQLYVRTHWTEDRATVATKAIRSTADLIGADHTLAELYYLEGRIQEENQNYTEAVQGYDLALSDIQKYKLTSTSFGTERLMWLKSWILYKQKNFEEAEKSLQALVEKTEDLSEKSRAQFYRARSLKFLLRDAEAKVLLEQVSQTDFFGYYGLVSYRELGKKLPALSGLKSTNSIKFDLDLKALADLDRRIYVDLIKYREFNIAEKAVSLMSKSKDDEVNLALYLAQKSQIYMPVFRQFARLTNTEKMDLFIAYPELIFPQPYQDQVNEMSTKTKLPSSLIYSIMKQESAFNERARSPADAFGLMQVIPGLARQLSRKFEVPYRHQVDLFDPIINIQLGSYELMEQVRKQNGQLTYVAAAYNAGPNALSSWLKSRKRDDVLEFIEEIPYDETKTYVKLIARNKLFYERISNRDTEHDFPSDFLN